MAREPRTCINWDHVLLAVLPIYVVAMNRDKAHILHACITLVYAKWNPEKSSGHFVHTKIVRAYKRHALPQFWQWVSNCAYLYAARMLQYGNIWKGLKWQLFLANQLSEWTAVDMSKKGFGSKRYLLKMFWQKGNPASLLWPPHIMFLLLKLPLPPLICSIWSEHLNISITGEPVELF